MENELIHDKIYVLVCDFCRVEFIIKKEENIDLKELVESTYGWCGQCIDGNS